MEGRKWQTNMVVDPRVNSKTILKPNKPEGVSSLTKVICTLGPKTHSVEVIEECLTAGMSVARFDFSWLDAEYHQKTLDNLRKAGKNVKKLCAVMLDTVGPELHVINTTGNPIELKVGDNVTITPDLSEAPSSKVLPVNYPDLSKVVKRGDTVFVGQYLFTGSETTSVWLEMVETNGEDVICVVKNTATLAGFIFTMHVSQAHINVPTLTDEDKKVISTWGSSNNVDIISLSYTRSAEDVKELRAFLETKNLSRTQIFAKIENIEGLEHFDEILGEADGIILSRGNLGIDLPAEKVFLFQKSAVDRCNMAGKPVIVTRVMDSMTDNLRPTRAEATDVANAVLDGTDGILLGAETLRGLYPVHAIKTVGQICNAAENVYNYALRFKRIANHAAMSYTESVASSAVRAAIEVKAPLIVVFTSSGKAVRLIAKYRPKVPVLAIFIPKLKTNSLTWNFSGISPARQSLALRGIYPILASPNLIPSVNPSADPSEAGLMFALKHAPVGSLVDGRANIVVFQKIGELSVFKIHSCIVNGSEITQIDVNL